MSKIPRAAAFRLAEWLRLNAKKFEEHPQTRDEVAAAASSVIGIDLSTVTLRKVAADAGVKIAYANTPRISKSLPVGGKSAILGRCIVDLYEKLGETPPADLIALARPVNAESNGKSH